MRRSGILQDSGRLEEGKRLHGGMETGVGGWEGTEIGDRSGIPAGTSTAEWGCVGSCMHIDSSRRDHQGQLLTGKEIRMWVWRLSPGWSRAQ